MLSKNIYIPYMQFIKKIYIYTYIHLCTLQKREMYKILYASMEIYSAIIHEYYF